MGQHNSVLALAQEQESIAARLRTARGELEAAERRVEEQAAAAEVATLELQNSKLREEQLQAACDERDAVVGRLTVRITRRARTDTSRAGASSGC